MPEARLDLAAVRRSLDDDDAMWQRMREVQRWNIPALLTEVPSAPREETIARGVRVVHDILSLFNEDDFSLAEPAHGAGHMVRDYVSALRFARRLEIDSPNLFVGLVAGVFHDTGCMVLPRYEEGRHTAPHAESGAFLLDTIFRSHPLDLNRAEKMLIEYGISAHTSYLMPMTLQGSDGIQRRLEPYRCTAADGRPLLAVWFPRWVDRQDNSGPGWVGRHYLSFVEPHEEIFNQREGTRFITYEQHMRPLLRTESEIQRDPGGRTMLEYFATVLSTQHTGSPYCPYDYGAVAQLRDHQSRRLGHIVDALRGSMPIPSDLEEGMVLSGWNDASDGKTLVPDSLDEEEVVRAWTAFLAKNLEPTGLGERVANQLEEQFRRLDLDTRKAWTRGFWMTMKEYAAWATEALEDLAEMPPHWCRFKPITDNVADMIRPNRDWLDLLTTN